MSNEVGLIGLGVMGQSLAANMANKGFQVAVYNRNIEKTNEFVKTYPSIKGYDDIPAFLSSLKLPRIVILMVTAGEVVDTVSEALYPYLDKGDIIVDCGNSFYQDSEKRMAYWKEKGIHFIGSGVSGGEKGALLGPSIMPSGAKEAYDHLEPIFTRIAAQNDDNTPCCTYVGKGGSGHFVKMVHNGIEYADMQLISEVYSVLKILYQDDNEKIQALFEKLNQGKLNSYLLEITSNIFKVKEDKEYLIDKISDVAAQKGTGKWTAQVSLDCGVPIPSMIEAVEARFLSTMNERGHKSMNEKPIQFSEEIESSIEKAFYLAKISIYAQGFSLMKKVSEDNSYDIDFKNLANIWKNGCIIKSAFLDEIMNVFQQDSNNSNLLLSEVFTKDIEEGLPLLQNIVSECISQGMYVPVLSSSLNYIQGLFTKRLSTNLVQAQRDYFGAHTYERVDKEGSFHTIWE